MRGQEIDALVNDFSGKGYGDLKAAVTEACIETLSPLQAEYARIVADKPFLEFVMKSGSERAEAIARKTMAKVHKKVGLAPYKL